MNWSRSCCFNEDAFSDVFIKKGGVCKVFGVYTLTIENARVIKNSMVTNIVCTFLCMAWVTKSKINRG